jgi:hypothetical protein
MSLHTPLPTRKNYLMFEEQQCSALLSVTKNLRNFKIAPIEADNPEGCSLF